MDSTLFKYWFFDKFIPRCRSSLRKIGLSEKALLLLDNATFYLSSETLVTEDQQIRCVFLPTNTTSLIQPMDQGVLQNIKMLFHHDLLMKAVDREEEGDVSYISLVKSLSIKDCVLLVSRTWECV